MAAKTLQDFQTALGDLLDDTTLDVDIYINRALDYCSNFFPNIIKTTLTQTADGKSIAVPERMFDIKKIAINGDDIKELTDISKVETAEAVGAKRWHHTHTMIYFTFTVKTTDEIDIVFEQRFVNLSDAADETDVPQQYQPLVITCAFWMCLKRWNSMVNANREKYPDVDPDEIRRARDAAKEEFDDMLKSLQLSI